MKKWIGFTEYLLMLLLLAGLLGTAGYATAAGDPATLSGAGASTPELRLDAAEAPAENAGESEDGDQGGEPAEEPAGTGLPLRVGSVSYEYTGDYTWDYTWEYAWQTNGFMASCRETGDYAVVTLSEGSYTYCPENIPETFPWIEDVGWSEREPDGIAPYLTVYRQSGSSDEWQYGFPDEGGTYQVALALFPGIETEPAYWELLDTMAETATVTITHAATGTWEAEGCALVTRCSDGGETLASVSLSGDVTEYLCEENPDSNSTIWFRDDNAEAVVKDTMPEIVTLYQGTGSTAYALSATKPTTAGTYQMYLAVLRDPENPKSATLQTEPRSLTLLDHEWTYDTGEYSLTADCNRCGAHAGVTIDTSTVYEASRNYNGESLDYEVFYEENWSSQAGIEPYQVLFSGYQTYETATTVYDRAFVKPDSTGNYTVRLALLEDPEDPDTAWLSTREKPYYLADIGIGSCQITSYGSEQIAQFTEPASCDGVYQVGTLSELLWCLYNKNLSADIALTNDIVVNPITVNEKGEIRCGSYQVYTWDGFGTDKTAFQGSIIGGGYTIYGIYLPYSNSRRSGLVDYGKDARLADLTVENSVFYGVDTGAMFGHYESTTQNTISNCHVLNCYTHADNTAGAIIGWLTSSVNGDLTIQTCSNDSIICGESQYGAGGILGKAEDIDSLRLEQCRNLGDVSSTRGYAGGILGWGKLCASNGALVIYGCFNTGAVNCPDYAGGIAGYLTNNQKSTQFFIDNCTSVGYLYSSKNLGGITGYTNTDSMYYSQLEEDPYTEQGNYFYNASVGFNGGSAEILQLATRLTRSQVNGGFVCARYGHTACSHRTVVSAASCTVDGALSLSCAVCNAVMESEPIAAHGHRYEYGQCIFCGAYEDEAGSLFGNLSVACTVSAAGAMVLMAGIWYGLKRKKAGKTR